MDGSPKRKNNRNGSRGSVLEQLVETYIREGRLPGASFDHPAVCPEKDVLTVCGGNKYRLLRLIARGGMGTVYEALDLTCDRRVAIKFMPETSKSPEEDILRFVREAQITAQLGHPNVMPIYELGCDHYRRLFYAMKLVQGDTLTDIIVRLRRGDRKTVKDYPLHRLLMMIIRICDAIAFAHSKGIIHRDLKPDNILVGDFGEILVTDWGLAKGASEGDANTPKSKEKPQFTGNAPGTLTMYGRVLGTPGYMSIEQAAGDPAQIGPPSDVYALGALLYTLLTLHVPVSEKEMSAYIRRIRSRKVPPPTAWNQGVPEDCPGPAYPLLHCPGGRIPTALSDISMKAMEPVPADRHASVQALQRDLEDFQSGLAWEPVVDTDFSNPESLNEWTIAGGEHELSSGELRLRHGEPQVILLNREVPGDVRIEFECRLDGGYLNEIGSFFGAVVSRNIAEIPYSGYRLEYGAYDNSINCVMRAEQKLFSQPDSPLVAGKTYRVIAERVGNHLRLEVNGKEVFSVTDPNPLYGPDHIAAGVFGWGAYMRFRRIRVSQRTSPSRADVLDLADRQIQRGRFEAARALYEDVLASSPDEQRRRQARRGLDAVDKRQTLASELSRWREQIKQAWPGVRAELHVDSDGLSMDIMNCGISDLDPLRGLPLTSLYCSFNRIESLEPLRGMPLRQLRCAGNLIESLEPLRGMSMETLQAEGCRIASLEPLRGMPMTFLNIARNRIVSLEPLTGMKLSFLCCFANRINSLEPVKGMPLLSLLCHANPIDSLEPLRGLPLSALNCSGCNINSLEPLRGMPLTILHCGENKIDSLKPLTGMPLTMVTCHCNPFTSLLPFKGAPMSSLACGRSNLTTLIPFLNNPPDDFRFDCDSIGNPELLHARDIWNRDFRHLAHAKDASVLLALRAGDKAKVKSLSAEFRGRRYLHVPKWVRWEEARDFCESLGGHLATILSAEENIFVESLFRAGCWSWFGLRIEDGVPKWINGDPVEYTNFADPLQASLDGPKIFGGKWHHEAIENAINTFIIQWDE